MKFLVTGGSGFIGTHLSRDLAGQGHHVAALYRQSKSVLEPMANLEWVLGDVTDRPRIFSLVNEFAPDVIFHLAGQSLIMPSWNDPDQTMRINVIGTLNLLDAVRQAGIDPVIAFAGSSSEYKANREGKPIKESDCLEPSSPYGVSKLTADLMSLLYWRNYRQKIVRVRPFFVIGPGKHDDICADLARGIVEIERGKSTVLKVGNLEAVRDFIDVGDALRAFELIVQKGEPGEVYNLCTGHGLRIADLLEQFLKLSSSQINVQQDASRMRPLDEPVKIGDPTKLNGLGWKTQVPIEKTVRNIIEYWRRK